MISAAMSYEALSLVALALAAVPAGLCAWNLWLYRSPPQVGNAAVPAVSVLIPARNEEREIEGAVRAILSNRGALEIIVLDDHSTDRTASIVEGLAAEDGRVRLVQAEPLPTGWSGKQHACHSLSRHARHDLMMFVDADVRLAPDAVERISAYMAARPGLGLASGFPRQRTGTFTERLAIPLIQFLLMNYLPIWGMRRFRWAAFGAGNGQLFIARRDAYARAGGHAAIARSLHDGVKLPRAFRAQGIMTDLFDATGLATCRMYRGAAEVWSGFSKNAVEGMATPVALPVWTVLLLGGHVLPFLLLAYGLATGAALSPGATRAALACLIVLGMRFVLAGRFRQPLIGAVLHPIGVLLMLAIQWNALLNAARGRTTRWRGRSYQST